MALGADKMNSQEQLDNKSFFPVTLMLATRPCLVVGGGKVAAHKTELLLNAGADVTVISPEINEKLNVWQECGRISYVARPFTPADVEDMFLAFAATNNRKVNTQVREACHANHILVCSVDKDWCHGDFVTPAVLRRGELTVSVSTGGKSCRRSRLVKNNLAQHIELVDSANLMVVGTSHNYIPIDEREPYHLVDEKLMKVGTMLNQVWGMHEFLLLNTCNRVELIAVVTENSEIELLIKHILGFDKLRQEGFYLKRGLDAFEHTCVLNAGLLSQTPGEKHIAGQVKQALADAKESEWAGGMLEEWMSSTLHVSKHIRSAAEPLLQTFEIEDCALMYADAQVPDLNRKHVLVLGTGEIGRGVVERLIGRDEPLTCDWCYNRQKPEIPLEWDNRLRVGTLNELKDRLSQADVVISAAGGSGYILHQGHAPFFDQEKNIHIVDLAMPRTVDPALDGLSPNFHVADLDDLKHWYRREAVDMTRIFELSRTAVHEHRDMYDKILNNFQGTNASSATEKRE